MPLMAWARLAALVAAAAVGSTVLAQARGGSVPVGADVGKALLARDCEGATALATRSGDAALINLVQATCFDRLSKSEVTAATSVNDAVIRFETVTRYGSPRNDGVTSVTLRSEANCWTWEMRDLSSKEYAGTKVVREREFQGQETLRNKRPVKSGVVTDPTVIRYLEACQKRAASEATGDVFFAPGSSQVGNTQLTTVDSIIDRWGNKPKALNITGYSGGQSERGDPELANARAKAVRDYLMRRRYPIAKLRVHPTMPHDPAERSPAKVTLRAEGVSIMDNAGDLGVPIDAPLFSQAKFIVCNIQFASDAGPATGNVKNRPTTWLYALEQRPWSYQRKQGGMVAIYTQGELTPGDMARMHNLGVTEARLDTSGRLSLFGTERALQADGSFSEPRQFPLGSGTCSKVDRSEAFAVAARLQR